MMPTVDPWCVHTMDTATNVVEPVRTRAVGEPLELTRATPPTAPSAGKSESFTVNGPPPTELPPPGPVRSEQASSAAATAASVAALRNVRRETAHEAQPDNGDGIAGVVMGPGSSR